MRLAALLEGFAPRTAVGDDPVIGGLGVDSRRIAPGDAFVALAGTRQHGLVFAGEAIRRGCAAILWEPRDDLRAEELLPAPLAVPLVAIPHLGVNLGELASRFHGHPSRAMSVIGVTGTNGKSSYVHLLARAVAPQERTGTIGTLGAGVVGEEKPLLHTTPDAAAVQALLAGLRDAAVKTVAMEVSSHALDQGRVNGIAFRGAAFTNLSRDHLDYHGTMARYTAAKARLMTFPGLEFAILNADDERVDAFRRALAPGVRRIEYGLRAGDVRADGLAFEADGTRFELILGAERAAVRTPLLGRFNVYNALAVAATLRGLGWDAAAIADALAASVPVPGRMNAIVREEQPLVVIDYAHTPDALAQCLAALREHAPGRDLICVFGCGGDRDRGKRPEMGAIAERLADRVIVTDDNPRSEDGERIVRDILAGMAAPGRVHVERDRAAAIAAAVELGGAGDLVLVAGKGHEDYQEVAGKRHAFDDRRVAEAVLERAS